MDVANPSLLLTKLGIPPLHPNTVSRPRLLSLPAAHSGASLVLVSGPAGFGKTTLLAAWCRALAARGDTLVAWYSLDERDDDPLRFLSHLIASLSLSLGDKADLNPARQALQSGAPEDTEYVVTLLLNALVGTPDRILLALDDYHLISSPAVHSAVAFLLEHLPPQMSLAMASRSDPPLQLSRLRARGRLIEIRATDLRFTPDETTAFLHNSLSHTLATEEVTALHNYTEGWPAGLQLTALALRQRAARSDSTGLIEWLSTLAAPRRNVFDYLADEVFEQQPPGVRTFLMETSVLDRLTPALCDEITGRQDAAELLDELERAGLFLVPLDEERRWYRYHHAFREFLRERLSRDLPDRVDELLRDASRWYEWQGQAGESLHYAMEARDFDRAARLVETSAEEMWLSNEVDTLLGWISALPEDVVAARPRLPLFAAFALLHKHRTAEADAYLDVAERTLDVGPRGDTPSSRSMPASQGEGSDPASAERAMLASLRSLSAVIQGRSSDAEDQATQALDSLPAGMLAWRAIALVAMGVARGLVGDTPGAERALTEAKTVSRAAGATSISFIAEYNLASLQLLRGDLRAGERNCRDLLHLADERGARHLHHVSETQVELGMALCERNEVDEAHRHAGEALEVARQTRQESTIASAHQLLARISQARGDLDGALEAVEAARTLARERSVFAIAGSAGAQRAQLLLLRGDVEAAERWARELVEAGEVDVEPPLHPFPFEATGLARVWIARGRHDEAGPLLDQILAAAEARGWAGRTIEALALRATDSHVRGDEDAALAALARALEMAEPRGFARVFLDEGAPMLELLRRAASGRGGSAYARHLLTLTGDRSGQARNGVPFQPLADPLSARELEVLAMVAEGATNQEIADALVVAVGTVKIHLNRILSKLAVRNRTEATAKARELSLL